MDSCQSLSLLYIPLSVFLLPFPYPLHQPTLRPLSLHSQLTPAQSDSTHLNAHGAGIISVNNTYYLIGEDKSQGSPFLNVNCYSSTDLVRWQYEGALLSRTGTSGDLGPNRIIERPKVIYNDRTGKFVMWMHVDSSDYKDARVGVAVGDSVCGKYCEYTSRWGKREGRK